VSIGLKCQFHKDRVDFLGFSVSAEGVKPLNGKVEAIKNLPQPKTITELRRFLGMVQQLSRFSAKLPKIAEPLRGLLSSKNNFLWTDKHSAAFYKIKTRLASQQH